MDVDILWISLIVVAEIIGIFIFFKKVKSKVFIKYKIIFAVFCSIIVVLQIFAIVNMLILEGVFEPSQPMIESSSMQDPSSKTVVPLLRKEDFPESWEWVNVSVQQPSKFPWKDSPTDSAESILIARVPHFLIFKHYVRVLHWDAVYDTSISEEEFINRISTAEDETSFVPNVKKAGEHFHTMCHKGSDFYSCDLAIGYKNQISYIVVNTPQDFGEHFTINLLNSIVEKVGERLK